MEELPVLHALERSALKMKVLPATAWNCFIGWLASIVLFFIVGFPIGSSTKGLTPLLYFASYSGLIIFGVGLPLASLTYRRLSQRGKTPHPAAGLGIGVTVSQIVLLSVGGIYFFLIVREDGPRILWNLVHSMYNGSSSIFFPLQLPLREASSAFSPRVTSGQNNPAMASLIPFRVD